MTAWRDPTGPGHWLVDLVAANRQQLRLAVCVASTSPTAASPRRTSVFFSDRAARPCGRFALLARLVD